MVKPAEGVRPFIPLGAFAVLSMVEALVAPKAGTALLFIHDTWHEGSAVTDGVKYVLRSEVLYGVPEQ